MERRSFLSLLIAGAAAAPELARLQTLAAPEPLTLPEPVQGKTKVLVAMTMALPFLSREPIGRGRIEVIEAFPQSAFSATRLMIRDAAQFQILGVSASGQPMIDEFISAEFFSPHSYGATVQFATVPPGQRIVMAVRNLGEPRTFAAMFMGRVLVEREETELGESFPLIDEPDDDDDFEHDFDEDLEDDEPDRLM